LKIPKVNQNQKVEDGQGKKEGKEKEQNDDLQNITHKTQLKIGF
jgi:hypothetical protein